METIIMGYIGVILGLYWDNGKENGNYYNRLVLGLSFRWTPHPVIVTIRDNRDYIRVLLYILIIPLLQGWGSS